jgi:signal transduction histidine kinase
MNRLLVVDDDPDIVRLLSRFLRRQGYDVATAPDGEEALSLLAREPCALVVTDITMPKMDGLGVLKGAKKLDPDVEVIILTGAGVLASAITAIREGAYDYLLKPLDRLEQLGEVVQRALEHRRLLLENRQFLAELREANQRLEEKVTVRTADLEQANRRLAEALRVKVEFLGQMSHELRTPLNFILGFTGLLQEGIAGPLTPKQAHYVDRIQGGGTRLMDLVNNILGLSRVEAGTNRLSLESIPLGALFREVQERVGIAAAQKGLEIAARLDPAMSALVADRGKLVQILAHLLENAVKFTPDQGKIALTARCVNWSSSQMVDSVRPVDQLTSRPIDSPGEWLEITVEDTGMGIASDNLERVFEPFHQVDGSQTRAHGGAGVGLALVRTLVELHGGRVRAESEGLGRGARFIVRLPVLAVPTPPRILVVEDEAPLREALCAALAVAGYGVDPARTVVEALERLAAARPDLLVLDIGLPDADGWEVLKRVRGAEGTRDLPVLVLTGLGYVHADQALALGADEFLAKPVSAQVLVETVARLLTRGPGATAKVEEGSEH